MVAWLLQRLVLFVLCCEPVTCVESHDSSAALRRVAAVDAWMVGVALGQRVPAPSHWHVTRASDVGSSESLMVGGVAVSGHDKAVNSSVVVDGDGSVRRVVVKAQKRGFGTGGPAHYELLFLEYGSGAAPGSPFSGTSRGPRMPSIAQVPAGPGRDPGAARRVG